MKVVRNCAAYCVMRVEVTLRLGGMHMRNVPNKNGLQSLMQLLSCATQVYLVQSRALGRRQPPMQQQT